MESRGSIRVVLDTNTLLRGLASRKSAAARVLAAAEARRIIPLLSKPVLNEYWAVLTEETIVRRFPEITPVTADVAIRRLLFVGDYLRTPGVSFTYPRDPRDEKFIELAIASSATHIITSDDDLLSLPTSRSDAGKRFRQRLRKTQVVTAETFARIYAATWPAAGLPDS